MLFVKEETKVWLQQADESFKDALYLYKGSRNTMAVFCCHQALEKLLKACIIELANKAPSKTHELKILAKESTLELTEERLQTLDDITKHFWKVRYPDYRKHVYNNTKLVEEIIVTTKGLYLWIENELF